MYVSKLSPGRNILALTVYQFWVGGILGVAFGFLTEAPPDPAALAMDVWFNIFYLVIFASCIALVIQNVALAHVPPAQASLFLSLESVFGVLFSVWFFGESLTWPLIMGFALIFAAIIISEVFPFKSKDEVELPEAAQAQSVDLLAGDAMAMGELEVYEAEAGRERR